MKQRFVFCLVIAAVVSVGSFACAHGPTICIGQVQTSATSATLDLRVGVGLLHKIVDPDDSASISDSEWAAATPVIRDFFTTGIHFRKDDGTTLPHTMAAVDRPNDVEIRGIASIDLSAIKGQKYHLTLPLLGKLDAAPPCNLSVWSGEKMLSYPGLLFYGRSLEIPATP